MVEYAQRHGVQREDLLTMIDGAARFSKGRCNRRYKDWLFEVRGKQVVYMTPFVQERRVPKPGPGEFLVFEECDECQGAGCNFCEGTGEVPVIRREPRQRGGW